MAKKQKLENVQLKGVKKLTFPNTDKPLMTLF